MSAPKSILVGLGNPILSDDAVGIVVARHVWEALGNRPYVNFVEAAVGGFELVEMLAGYDKAVIVDAIQTEGRSPGEFSCMDFSAVSVSEIPSMTHQVGLVEGLELARRLKMKVPRNIHLYAIEAADVTTFGTAMTDSVAAAVSIVAEHILSAEFGEGG
jgi:hydrogenase maturation protease